MYTFNYAHPNGHINLVIGAVWVLLILIIAPLTVFLFVTGWPWFGLACLALTVFSGWMCRSCIRDGLAERRAYRADRPPAVQE